MATIYLLACILLWGLGVDSIQLENIEGVTHISAEGQPYTVFCPPHDDSYTYRQWRWEENLLRRDHIYFTQTNGQPVNTSLARADMSVNPADFSLTISSLQVKDSGKLHCVVNRDGQNMYANQFLIVYSGKWMGVQQNTNVTIQCPVGSATGYTTRRWYRRAYTDQIIYSQNSSGVTKGPKARDDISLNAATFELTIGDVMEVDYRLICIVSTAQGTDVGLVFLGIYPPDASYEAEENSAVSLPCDGAAELASPMFNNQYYTRTWQRVNGATLYRQYKEMGSGLFYEDSPGARADMALNNETFALTIGRAKMDDSTLYICVYNAFVFYFETVKLTVYVNPKITVSGLDDSPVSVGSTVTVTCTIDRVYPELGPGAFKMRWGTETIMSTGSQNGDKSYRYTVSYTYTIMVENNGTVVECHVNPTIGQSDSVSTVVIVGDGDQSGSSLPVMNRVIAVAAVLFIIVFEML